MTVSFTPRKANAIPQDAPKNYLIYGPNRAGKTYLGTTAPNALILTLEDRSLYAPNETDVQLLNTHTEIVAWVNHIREYPKKWKWVIFDGVSALYDIGLRKSVANRNKVDPERIVMSNYNKQWEDWSFAEEFVKTTLTTLIKAETNVIFTANEYVEEDTVMTEVKGVTITNKVYTPFLSTTSKSQPKIANHLLKEMDLIGRMYVEQEGNTITRMMQVGPSPTTRTGYRGRGLVIDKIESPVALHLKQIVTTQPQPQNPNK